MTERRRRSRERPQEILAYLQAKQWSHSLEGDNYKIQTCLFCGNTSSNFEIHKDRGMYKTWCCGEQGSFYSLKERLGDVAFTVRKLEEGDQKTITEERKIELTSWANEFHANIWNTGRPQVLEYLRARGFSDQTIRHFRFGCQKLKGIYWLTIPHFVGDKCVNLKYRAIPPADRAWRQEKDSEKVLFNQNSLAHYEEIIVTEGELKSAALFQMGFENTVSLTGGIQNIQPGWVDLMDNVKKIYLVMDSDVPGQKGAEEIAMRFGPEKCFNVVLQDAKDPDEWFFQKNHTAEEFEGLLRKAKQIDIKNIISLNRAFGLLQEEIETDDVNSSEGLLTPWPKVNNISKGFKPGELIVLSAPPKVGKTTFALDIALFQVDQGNPILFFCMEMSSRRIARKITCNKQNIYDEQIEAMDVVQARYRMRGKPFYLPEGVKRGMTSNDVMDAIKACYRRYGIKMVIFDNLHFLVRSSENLREKIGEVSQEFKLLAEELRIPIILIVHPRKLHKPNKAMTADDFKESASIHADADQIIILHRERVRMDTDSNGDFDPRRENEQKEQDTPMRPETSVIIDASRFTEGGKVMLYYHGAKSKFTEIE